MAKDLKLNLPQDVLERIDAEVMRTITIAVEACADRDADMRELRAISNCEDDSAVNGPYEGSCDLADPVAQELCRTVEASLRQALGEKPFLYQALHSADVDTARIKEQWINARLLQDGFRPAFSSVVRNAVETLGGVLCADWTERYEYKSDVVYLDKETGEPATAEQRDPMREYEEQQIMLEGEVTTSGLNPRCVDPWNITTWPINVSSLDGADRIHEYMELTRSDLLLGMMTLGYDKTAVMDAIKRGPGGTQREEDELRALAQSSAQEDAPYRCYQVIGRIPVLMDPKDGEKLDRRIPETMLFRDCYWLVCPDLNLTFKRCLWDSDVLRPYTIFRAYIRPNCLWGDGVTSQIRGLYAQATGLLRAYIDGTELSCSPQTTVEEQYADFLDGHTNVPGGVIGLPPGAHPQPWTVDPTGPNLALQGLQYVVARTHQDVSADQASAMLSGKVRKQAEVAATQSLMGMKFALPAANIEFAMLDWEPRAVSQYLAHMTDAGETIRIGASDVNVTREALSKRYRVVAQVSTEQLNQETRIARIQAALEQYRQSPLYKLQISQMDFRGEYAMMSELLGAMGFDPEAVLGTEEDYKRAAMAMAQEQQAQAQAAAQQQAMTGQVGGGSNAGQGVA